MSVSQEALTSLLTLRAELQHKLADVNAAIDKHRVKCPTCRCRILPGQTCGCCLDYGDEEQQ